MAGPYPIYKSLRFRFGLIFGFAFLFVLVLTGIILYSNVKNQFEKSFAARLKTQANLILEETEISPVTIPLPASGEYFRLIYDANGKQDTLFNNLPASKQIDDQQDTSAWRNILVSKELETGGSIRISYKVAAAELEQDIDNVQIILFLYFPLAFLAALIVGFSLSGFLLRPIENIVTEANHISLQSEIGLLEEPVVRDELHQLTISLNQMLGRIQKQARDQNAFFASASHELRTPLSVMLTELQILQNDEAARAVRPVINSQITEVRRLNKLVNEFLLLSQLKSGALVLNKKPVNLAEVTIEVLEHLSKKALANAQTFKIEMQPEDSAFEIYTDRSHLVTILRNLLENVLKHGLRASAVRIKISEDGGYTTLVIQNQSYSDIKEVAALTAEFKKQDLKSDGFGLGLWIVARLSERIGAGFKIGFTRPDFTAELSFPPKN